MKPEINCLIWLASFLTVFSISAQSLEIGDEIKLTAADGAAEDRFGWSVSISGETAIVSAFFDDDNGSKSGSAYVFVRNGNSWVEQAKLTASEATAEDRFGWSVSISGETAIIGAYGDDDDNVWGSNSGAAYVFVRNGDQWTQQARLTASDAIQNSAFGWSTSISGETAIVGADRDDDDGNAGGAAYVFVRNGDQWTQQAKLTAADGLYDDHFSRNDSLSISGETAIVGASGDNDDHNGQWNGGDRGAAYVFVREGDSWTQQAKLMASDGEKYDQFGFGVSISGETAIVGATGDDDNGEASGSAYVFVRDGTEWTQQAKLIANDGVEGDFLGGRVSISGETAIIGAYFDDDNGENSGSAYVFVREGDSWTQQGKLTAADRSANDFFGINVSISGETAIVGAERDDDNGENSGSAYIYDLSSDTDSETGTDSLPNQILWNKDGAEMAYIPAGSFEMGDHFGEGEDDETPVHTVTLDGFYMDKTEVTVGQFKAFLDESDYSWDSSWDSLDQFSPSDDYPMIHVNWNDAVAYAEWAGKRLPTEAEWEYAARGDLQGKRYPWGDEIDNTKAHYNGSNGTKPVGSYAANGYGLYDVAGNVWEWCADWYGSDYYASSPATNPPGPDTGSHRVQRGGHWNTNVTSTLRVDNRSRSTQNDRYGGPDYYGFRCVSGLNFTSDSFTTLLPVDDQTGSNWFADLSLDPADYTWSAVDTSSATLTVRLFVQPLGGIDASAWDFSAVSTVDALVEQLGSDGLNLVEGTDYQLLVVGQDDNGTADDASDDVTETISIQLSDLSVSTPSQPVSLISQVTVTNLSSSEITITFVTDQPALTSIQYGTTTAVDQQLPETGTTSHLHSLKLSGLNAETDYYFKVVAGDLTDDNQGSCYHFTTSTVGSGNPYTVYGQVFQEDGSTPAEEVIVHLSLTNSSGAGSHTLSALTASDGYWIVDLGNLKDNNSQQVLNYAANDVMIVRAKGGPDGFGQLQATVSSSPQEINAITLQQTISLNINLVTGLNLITLPVEPITAETAGGVLSAVAESKEVFSYGDNNWGPTVFVDADTGQTVGEDFDLQVGVGYMVHAGQSSQWTVEGKPIQTAFSLALTTGLNLVGVPYPGGLSAKAALPTISGGQVITRWVASSQLWSSVVSIPAGIVIGQDFQLESDQGCFIQVSQDSSWTPSQPATAPYRQPEVVPSVMALSQVTAIQHLTVGNLSAGSASAAFQTDGVGRSSIQWRKSGGTWQTSVAQTSDQHLFQLEGLQPQQQYQLQAEVIDARGQKLHSQIVDFQAAGVGVANPQTVYGQVLSINGQAKANQLVLLQVPECSPMLARTDQQGFWSLNLGNLKSGTGQSHHSQSGETVGLKLLGDSTVHQQIITGDGLQQLKTIRYQQQSDGGITTADRPDQTQLGANYPNPFNPETWIPYQLSQESEVNLEIYDGQGRLVRKLELGWKDAGYYTTAAEAIYWDGRNANGESVSSGVYFYRLQAGDYSQTRKMVILK